MKTNKTEKIKTDLVLRNKDVIIKHIITESKSKSGIIIAEAKNSIRPTGVLIACGPDCKQDLIDGVGRMVMFNPYANLQLTDGYNNTYYYMTDSDVRCFITEDTIIMDANDESVKRIDIDKSVN
jgi:co-chaperonin GroES (HSP10)